MRANSWALAPATRELFNKNKVALGDLKAVWERNTVYICERDGSLANGKPRLVFLSSCSGLKDVDVGSVRPSHNNYTFASLGYLRVRNIVELVDGKVVNSANDEYLGEKAPVYAFK